MPTMKEKGRKSMSSFGKRLAELRKKRGLTQQQLCELVSVHVSQLSNYEGDRSQPTLEVIRKLSLVLNITADELVFDPAERMPLITDKELIKQWERVEELPEEDRKALKLVVEGLLVRRQINRLQTTTG
jgi:transcriptional regulator with XRE-family HTH domain